MQNLILNQIQCLQEIQKIQLTHAPAILPEHVFWHDSCTSTNVFLRKQLQQKPQLQKNHLLCVSNSQTAARGQHNRTWHAPVGNLYFSAYMPLPHGSGFQQLVGMLALEVAISLIHMPIIQSMPPQQSNDANAFKLGVKWPNDIVTHKVNAPQDPLLKCAGILIEPVYTTHENKQNIQGVIIGIGINANADTDSISQHIDNRPITSLKNILQQPIDLISLSAQTYQACLQAMHNFAVHNASLPKRFAMVDILQNKRIQVLPSNQAQPSNANAQQALTGVASGIANDGALTVTTMLKGLSSVQRVYAGSVSLMSNTTS